MKPLSQRAYLENLTELELLELADNYCSATAILRDKLKFATSGKNTSIINRKLKEFDIKYSSHFNSKYKIITKICPICQKEFKSPDGGTDETTTCGYSCANTYFRSGINNPNYKGNNYRTICFIHHEKKCIICGEDKIVGVHHLDENHSNNDINNLIPMCPTHHQYWHSRHKYLVEGTVLDYIREFKNKGI